MAGGTLVLLSGAGFVDSVRVKFGSVDAQDLRILSGTALSMRSPPASAPGPVDVTVTAGTQQSTIRLAFTYFDGNSTAPGPSLAGITPATGPMAGGTRGVLAGRQFAQGATVYFGEKIAARAVVVDSNRITFTSPARDAGLVDVVVVNPTGNRRASHSASASTRETARTPRSPASSRRPRRRATTRTSPSTARTSRRGRRSSSATSPSPTRPR